MMLDSDKNKIQKTLTEYWRESTSTDDYLPYFHSTHFEEQYRWYFSLNKSQFKSFVKHQRLRMKTYLARLSYEASESIKSSEISPERPEQIARHLREMSLTRLKGIIRDSFEQYEQRDQDKITMQVYLYHYHDINEILAKVMKDYCEQRVTKTNTQ